jgi:hypothetical protein
MILSNGKQTFLANLIFIKLKKVSIIFPKNFESMKRIERNFVIDDFMCLEKALKLISNNYQKFNLPISL